MKKILLLPIVAIALLLSQGTSWAGFSSGMTICHCPPGHGGKKCFEITINSQGAYNGHFPNHDYDHEGACSSEELSSGESNSDSNSNSSNTSTDTNYDLGSGTVDGFTVPKSAGSNWREQ